METLQEFLSFSDANVRFVALGAVLLAISSAMVGVFIVLRQKALVGDAVSHSILPGIAAAFLFSGSKHLGWLIVGAFFTGWLSLALIDWLIRHTRVRKDAAIALMLSVFFGLGMVLLTHIQHQGNAAQSGLESFIFGKAAALVGQDVWVFSGIAFLLILVIMLFMKELTLIAFDEAYATSLGLPVGKLDFLLTGLTVLAVITGVTAVGVVLMSAMLITPAVAARFWTHDIRKMMWVAAGIGAFSGLSGAYLSYIAPAMPTGPWMVVVSSLIAFISFFFAPRVGLVSRWWKNLKRRRKIMEEDILKTFYQFGEQTQDFTAGVSLEQLRTSRGWELKRLVKYIRMMQVRGRLVHRDGTWHLSSTGLKAAKRIVRLHRLWELYLNTYMHVAPHQVHENAEWIEHIITPELEKELAKTLGYPEKDPHNSIIP